MKVALARQLPIRWRELRCFADGWLQRLGDTLQRRQDVVRGIQWLFVGGYYFLLIVPAILPQPASRAEIFSSLAGWAEILFWGVWWPGVILGTMLFGQFWCGIFCPDGALTERISLHGRRGKIPAWVRWPGWPLLAFSVVLIYEHLVDAYGSPRAILLSVGSASFLALLCGYFFGYRKRIWCRYLCPASSLFSLLSRCAIFHFKVDREAWDTAPKPLPRAVDCPLLLDVRRLRSNEKCSMCGRCSAHRNAVKLSSRLPGSEIVGMDASDIRRTDAFAICAVLVGLCYGAMHGRNGLIAAELQTIWGAGNNFFLAGMSLTALILGGLVASLLWGAARFQRVVSYHLSYSLIPLAGCGLFLGALGHGLQILAEENVVIDPWIFWIRLVFVLIGVVWSWRLGRQILVRWYGQSVGWYGLIHGGLLGALAVLYQFTP